MQLSFSLYQLTYLKNGTKFLNDGCDAFMNENEIKAYEKIEGESLSKEIQSFQLDNDDISN
jgi:hypothetical protein